MASAAGERGLGLVLARANLRVVEDGDDVSGVDAVALAHANLEDAAGGLGGNGGVVSLDASADGDDAGGQRGRGEEDAPNDEGDKYQQHRADGDSHSSAAYCGGRFQCVLRCGFGCAWRGTLCGVRLGLRLGLLRQARRCGFGHLLALGFSVALVP